MPQTIQITETSPLLHDANCVYCHVDLELGDQVVVCDSCRSPHHMDCWQDNGNRCAMFGCEGTGLIAQSNPNQFESVSTGQEPTGTVQPPSTLAEIIVKQVIWPLGASVASIIVFFAVLFIIIVIGGLLLDALHIPDVMGLVVIFGGLLSALKLGQKVRESILQIRDRLYLSSDSGDSSSDSGDSV